MGSIRVKARLSESNLFCGDKNTVKKSWRQEIKRNIIRHIFFIFFYKNSNENKVEVEFFDSLAFNNKNVVQT